MACHINVTLKSGFSMPVVGLGTWQADGDEVEKAVDYALSIGYRHIDTAFYYQNEAVIGKVLKKYLDSEKIKREDLFIVTKLPFYGNRSSDIKKYMNLSLEALQLSYVDLYLIHAPIGFFRKEDGSMELDVSTDHIAIWKEMEKLVDAGKTRFIGVSNFTVHQVERILKIARIKPVTNQVEIHAYNQQNELLAHHKSRDITLTAYSPLGNLGLKSLLKQLGHEREIPNLMNNPVVLQIAKKYNKTPAQVLLRHTIQRGIPVVPKSVHPARIKENIEIFDFKLNSADVKKLDELDRRERIVDYLDFFPESGAHPELPFRR